mmetsp:Transcript_2842/g.9238  ORF Transcript_2842/g.9238 Transcript_2842/m.9238 type:complete len:243 (-) Transcript_2842:186-914(-)
MFAIECSKPNATNAVMGQKMARIFPAVDVDAIVPHTAKHTSQLQRTPLKNETANGSVAFIVAMPITAAFAAGAAAVHAQNARNASATDPTKFPTYDSVQFLASDAASTFPASTPDVIVITFPVKSSAPVSITSVSPAGRPTAPLRKLHRPGFDAASAGDAPPTHDMRSAPMPMSAPAEKPRSSVVAGSCAAFFSAAATTVSNTAVGGSASPAGAAAATAVGRALAVERDDGATTTTPRDARW